MPDDFEQRLRRALHHRATQVTPDPATWRKVEARLQRQRSLRLTLTGAVAAAVAVIAVLSIAPLVRTDVDIRGEGPKPAIAPLSGGAEGSAASSPDQPAAQPEAAARSAGAGFCAPGSGVTTVLASPAGVLTAMCTDGTVEPMGPAPPNGHPVFFDVSRVLFDREGSLYVVDLALREYRQLGPGTWPAVGPDGQVAVIVDEPGDRRQPRIVVRNGLDGGVIGDFPVFQEGAEEFTARHLTFVDGTRLAWEAGYEGSRVWTAQLDGRDRTPLDTGGQGTLAAPSGDGDSGLVAIRRCCVAVEGDRPTEASLVAVGGGTVTELLDLGRVAGFDVATPDLFVARAGAQLLVGDGQRLFQVDLDGSAPALLVSGDAATAAVPLPARARVAPAP